LAITFPSYSVRFIHRHYTGITLHGFEIAPGMTIFAFTEWKKDEVILILFQVLQEKFFSIPLSE
jgi:hypothetical protein